MSLENAFRRLAIRPSSVCHECRRSFTSSSQRRQQQSATAAMTELMMSNQRQSTAQAQRQSTPTAAPPAPSPASSAQSDRSHQIAQELINTASQRKRSKDVADYERQFTARELDQQITRRFKVGDVYAPHDLSGVEMSKWKKIRRKPKSKFDVLDQLNLNPLDHYKNFSIMSEYITSMGRIRHSNDTGLRPVNQRKMAKAIRRAMGMGLMPGVHRHPEIIKAEETERRRNH